MFYQKQFMSVICDSETGVVFYIMLNVVVYFLLSLTVFAYCFMLFCLYGGSG